MMSMVTFQWLQNDPLIYTDFIVRHSRRDVASRTLFYCLNLYSRSQMHSWRQRQSQIRGAKLTSFSSTVMIQREFTHTILETLKKGKEKALGCKNKTGYDKSYAYLSIPHFLTHCTRAKRSCCFICRH